jgi:hypothetical protein
VIAVSSLGAYLMLFAVASAAGFGGGLAFATMLAFGLSRKVDARLQQWLDAAADQIPDTNASSQEDRDG